MRYRLMHQNLAVAAIELDDETCTISKINSVDHTEHMPVGIGVKNGTADRGALNEWWRGRAIPASRDGIRGALESLQFTSTQQLMDKSYGLSLSDQYWICPDTIDLSWDDINFFDNAFSDDVGNILFGQKPQGEISLLSPDNTSDGWLKKKWKIVDGKRCLIKGGSGTLQQEPYNEVLASAIMKRLGIPHVPYKLMEIDGYPYSVCEDFITKDTELVSAWYIMQTQKKQNHSSVYQHYLNCCASLKIKRMAESLDRMLVLDFLIVNEDRHQNNFGVVRNAETLQFIGTAPIYDSGSSMWFSKPTAMIRAEAEKIACKPFKNSHAEQIKLVTSFDWLELSKLKDLDEEFREIVRGSAFIDDKRCDVLCRALKTRVELLEQGMRMGGHTMDSAEHDVAADVAYFGEPEL